MLFTAIKNTPLLRPNALPISANIGIICFISAFPDINDILLNNAQVIFVIDADTEQLIELNDNILERKKRKVPVLPFAEIVSRIDLIFVFFHNNAQYHPIGQCWRYMRNVGYESFYTFMPIPHIDKGFDKGVLYTAYYPEYYIYNKDDLEKAYSMLNDEESKSVFAARIRAIISGSIGYLRVSAYEDYFHPLVKPELGDVILDGGVSEDINSQIAFIKTIGSGGKYFGFEPDPTGFCIANESIKKSASYDNYELIPLGLWHRRDKLLFEMLGQGTCATKIKKENSIECDVLPVDEFVESRDLNKVDFIKLDIEGAEFNALKGAIKTITKFRPKLAISLYHQLQDLYFIPLFLKEICIDYEFYLGHHHSALPETILYARPKIFI